MKPWNLPDILRGGGTCLALAALLPLAAQDPSRVRAGEPARVKGPERSGGASGNPAAAPGPGRSGGEPGNRGQAQGQARGGGEGQNRPATSSRGDGEAQNRKVNPGPAAEAPNRNPTSGQGPGRAQAEGPARESAPSPVRRPVQLPTQNLGPASRPGAGQPPARTPIQEPAPPARTLPAPGGDPAPRLNPGQQPGQQPGRQPGQQPGRQPGQQPGQQPGRQPGSPAGPGGGPGHGAPPDAGRPEPGSGSGARLITPPRTTIVRPPAGGEVHRDPGGAMREVRTPAGAVIRYAPDGQRRVVVDRPDGRVVVSTARGRGGYIQRPLRIHDHAFVQRTYVRQGVATARIYQPWPYHGVTYAVYQPVRYYRPAFYTWTRRPWYRPVYYSWGWYGQPWFTYYRGWCNPYPYYVSPVFWLTDFMIAITLEDAYQARLDSAVAVPPPPPDGGITPEVKQAIADEVRRQLEQEQEQQRAAAQGALPAPSGPPPLFSDNVSRIFLVHTGVPVYQDGRELFLSEGDVVQLLGAPPAGAAFAEVKVLASRDPRCPKGSLVSVSLVDLQEMQNHLQATLDQGLDRLQAQQGQNGLPALGGQNLGATQAPYLAGVQPDPGAAAELSQAAQAAQEAGESGRVISQGMTIEEVHRVLGNPRQTASVGGKLIEVFPDFKVTYLEGRVTDVQ